MLTTLCLRASTNETTSLRSPTAMVTPSGCHAKLIFSPLVWTVAVHLEPERTSHTRRDLSPEIETNLSSLLGSQHTWSTLSLWPLSSSSFPDRAPCSTSQTLVVWSTQPLASLRPEMLHATQCTFFLCPVISCKMPPSKARMSLASLSLGQRSELDGFPHKIGVSNVTFVSDQRFVCVNSVTSISL